MQNKWYGKLVTIKRPTRTQSKCPADAQQIVSTRLFCALVGNRSTENMNMTVMNQANQASEVTHSSALPLVPPD